MSERQANNSQRPLIGVVTGDPNGIGAEIVASAWASKALHPLCRPLVIGSAAIVEEGIRVAGVRLRVRSLTDERALADGCGEDANVIDVLESTPYAVTSIRYGHDLAEAGAVSGAWLDHADRLAQAGLVQGTVMGPISAKAMDKAGTLSSIAGQKPEQPAWLLLRSGPLVIAHLTDHVPLREVSAAITVDAVHQLIVRLAEAMKVWGLKGKIGVAGFNPHASGQEETDGIGPAVQQAQAEGIAVDGPISPDSIFRHCIEGRYGAVVAMYHDQGHIPIKTWGFAGNNVVFLGQPYVHTTVAHGVAYDLAGQGRADCSMIRNAILNAATLATGQGFHGE